MNHDSLFVGIDVSQNENHVYMMNFDQKKLGFFKVTNNEPGAEILEEKVLGTLTKHSLFNVTFVLESTGIFSYHIGAFLASSDKLLPYNALTYCIDPKISKNYRKSFSDLDKTDPKDAFILADIARVGRTKDLTPVRATQFIALQRLTRHRFHITEQLVREKNYVLNNVFLKFSDFGKNNQEGTFLSDNFGATAVSILEDYVSIDEIIESPLEDLINLISTKSKNKISNLEQMAKVIKQSALNSYRLDKLSYKPINIAISSSLNIIRMYKDEMKAVEKAIQKQVKGLDSDVYEILRSIPGIGPVYAAGILAEIGSIEQFKKHDQLAKYAGLTWRKNQSGTFNAEDTPMTKTGNKYLRYYLIQVSDKIRKFDYVYKDFYRKKFQEVTTHQHKRALALTARKLVRLIHGLLSTNRLYKPMK